MPLKTNAAKSEDSGVSFLSRGQREVALMQLSESIAVSFAPVFEARHVELNTRGARASGSAHSGELLLAFCHGWRLVS